MRNRFKALSFPREATIRIANPASDFSEPVQQMSLRSIRAYVAVALLTSWVIQIPAIMIFGLDDPLTTVLFVVVMWSPTVLALVSMARDRAARTGVRWRLGKPWYLPIGIIVETGIGFAVLGILLVAGLATSGWFMFSIDGVTVGGGPWILGKGFQGWSLYVLNVLATAIAYSAISLVATVGEEFAWRGFLQGHLEQPLGIVPAILMVAVVWWAWHLPGLLAGYNFPETPILGAFVLFPLQMVGASLLFGWLTIRAGSFWPAALAHGAVNSIQQGVVGNLQQHGSALSVDLVRTGLILAAGLICLPALRAAGAKKAPVGDRPDCEAHR